MGIIRNEKGFTLIEMLLYFSLLSLIVITLSGFIYAIYSSRVKAQTVSEVEMQGEQTMDIILSSVRLGTSIISPTSGSSGASASLNVTDAVKSPTLFDLSSGAIRIKEGNGSYVNITSNSVEVSSLSFQNLSQIGSPGIVRVSFTINYRNSSGRNEYNYSKSFVGSAVLKW